MCALVSTPDYGYFAVMAASGRPEATAIDATHYPRTEPPARGAPETAQPNWCARLTAEKARWLVAPWASVPSRSGAEDRAPRAFVEVARAGKWPSTTLSATRARAEPYEGFNVLARRHARAGGMLVRGGKLIRVISAGAGRLARAIERELEQDGTEHLVQGDGGDGERAKAVTERRERARDHAGHAEREPGLRNEPRPTPAPARWADRRRGARRARPPPR